MTDRNTTKTFGIDPETHKLVMGRWKVPMPRSRLSRIILGIGLVIGGILGFLPILGFWMVPLGFIVLSHDVALVRRSRRRLMVWWSRRRKQPR